MSDIIYKDSDRRIVIERTRHYGSAFIALLERTIWGTKSTLYEKHAVPESLDRISDAYFFSLKVGGELVAVCAAYRKSIRVGDLAYPAFYCFDLAVAGPKQGQGYGKLLSTVQRSHLLTELKDGGIAYAYIEAENLRSLELARQIGFESIGRCDAIMFSRFHPRDDARVERLSGSQTEAVVRGLNEQYADHAFLDFEQSVKAQDYYILMESGEIVAGVQAIPQTYSLKRLPGVKGALLVHVLPHVPVLGAVFNPKNRHFHRFGNILVRPGSEAAAFTVMETILARHRLKLGLILTDKRSSVYQRIAPIRRFGLLQSGLRAAIQVVASFNNVSDAEIAEIRRRPVCVSIMDLS